MYQIFRNRHGKISIEGSNGIIVIHDKWNSWKDESEGSVINAVRFDGSSREEILWSNMRDYDLEMIRSLTSMLDFID